MNEILLNQTNLYTRSTIFKYIDMYAPPPPPQIFTLGAFINLICL